MDIHKYVRKLNVQRYLASNPFNPLRTASFGYSHSGLSNAFLFNPPGHLSPALRVFRDLALKDLDDMQNKMARNTKDIDAGIDSLCANKNMVIRPADKGGGIVILNKDDYMHEMYRILGDDTTYTLLLSNPNEKYRSTLETIVTRGYDSNILNKKEKVFLLPKAPRIPIIHYLPKVHKSLTCPPGHPIFSGINSVTSQVGKYIDFFCSLWYV